jgi:hypothetical protein
MHRLFAASKAANKRCMIEGLLTQPGIPRRSLAGV